jgi:hypothetical protein
MIEGAIDTPAFDAYVDHFLVPTLRSGNIVVSVQPGDLSCDSKRRL